MSASKSYKANEIELTGVVEQKPYGTSSKSAHNAVYLVTKDESYILRQRGANAFDNPELKNLIGKTIRATGKIRENIFFVKEWIVEA